MKKEVISWRKDLSHEERGEIDAEDNVFRKQSAKQIKRARDAMRRAKIRAGSAAIKLSEADNRLTFDIYLGAQIDADFHGRKIEVDHMIALKACCRDEATGRAGVSETLCMRLSPCEFDGSCVEPFWV